MAFMHAIAAARVIKKKKKKKKKQDTEDRFASYLTKIETCKSLNDRKQKS